ncbi:methyltransferase-like protein 13 [Trichogramma pretiosum]|uniref:methyltransferase-like protein 13 n=1 Tax=Trichogramma pretiosum TaxID=7493 RepID=UPI0006C98991|nr:methyltransferase-like protein 13 [Trichogramma pretiosum]
MNLLPESHQQFSQADYWNSFFKKRGAKSFEWYGEFLELSSYLLKYVKQKDDIIIVGCGNSTLGMNLYDANYRSIVNIDISPVAIKQMKELNKVKRPDLVFQQMDATKLEYNNEKFSVVIDKGTFDALMTDSKEETVALVTKYLEEIKRVLKNNGRYICISLLQEHILKTLITNLSQSCAIRIIRCHDVESKALEQNESSMPVFMVVATKFSKLPAPVLETIMSDSSPVRVSSIYEMINNVHSVQEAAFLSYSLKNSSTDDEIFFHLYKPNEKQPRYSIYILDQPVKRIKSYAAYFVPQGREVDWLFCTKEGRKKLLEATKYDRLMIVTLNRGQKYESIEAVNSELHETIVNFAPADLRNNKIPIISEGPDVGNRKLLYTGESDFSGPFVIEDLENESGHFRRLTFLNSKLIVQSEAKLKTITTKRKKKKLVVDLDYLSCEHHLHMTVSLKAATHNKSNSNALIVGLGGGALCMFIRRYVPHVNLLTVEIDKAILDAAKSYFDFIEDDKSKVRIADGIDYITQASSEGRKCDAILFDVDSKDMSLGMSCPPKQFIEPDFLQKVANCLSDDGYFILNLVARNETLHNQVVNDLKKCFTFISSYKLQDDLNEIICCGKSVNNLEDWKKSICEAAKKINQQVKAKSAISDELIDIESIETELSLE